MKQSEKYCIRISEQLISGHAYGTHKTSMNTQRWYNKIYNTLYYEAIIYSSLLLGDDILG